MNKNLIEKAFDSLTKNTPLVPVTIDETVIHITELSKATLSSYAKKAADNLRMSAARAGFHSGLGEYKLTQASIKQAQKRQDGIKKAVDKLTKEDVEAFVQTEEFNQLDELSKQTLGSYIKKASHSVATLGAVTRQLSNDARDAKTDNDYTGFRKKSNQADKVFKHSWKRRKGMEAAVDRLTKEDIEDFIQSEEFDQLDEISRETLFSYHKKNAGRLNRAIWKDQDASRDGVTGVEKNKLEHDRWRKDIGQSRAAKKLGLVYPEGDQLEKTFDGHKPHSDEANKIKDILSKGKKRIEKDGYPVGRHGRVTPSKSSSEKVKPAKYYSHWTGKEHEVQKEDIQYLIDNIDQLDESERYQLAQIALREDYTAKGNIYHGGETHKFKVTYGDFPSHKSIQEQNPHLKKHHVDAVMNHFEEHGDDDMTNTESEHEASGSEVHVHHNSGSY